MSFVKFFATISAFVGEPNGEEPNGLASRVHAGSHRQLQCGWLGRKHIESQTPAKFRNESGRGSFKSYLSSTDLIRDVDDYAAERQARAETLAQQTIEKVEIAEARVQSAESGRLAAEAETKEFSNRLQEVEKVMEQTASRMAATEAQLSTAEQRAGTAELRANEAEDALKRIEEAIRTQILEKIPSDSRRADRAA